MDKTTRRALILAFALVAAIFVLDWALPLFYAVWFLYVIPLLVVARPPRGARLLPFALGISLLILLGFFVSPLIPSGESIRFVDAVNRAVGGAALLVLAFSLKERNEARDALLEYQKKLEQLVENRTAELKETAKQLSIERTHLDNVLRQMPVGVMIAEAPSGRIVYANEQASRIREQAAKDPSAPEYQGFKAYHPNGRPYEPQEMPLSRALTGQVTVVEEEMRYFREDGTTGVLSINAAPVHHEAGASFSGVITLQDITDKKRMEEELKTYRENLEQLVQERTQELKLQTERLDEEVRDMNVLRQLSARYIERGYVQSLLQELVDAAVIISRADKGAVQLVDSSTARLKFMAHHGFGGRFLDFFDSAEEGVPACGAAMQKKTRVVVEDVFLDHTIGGDSLERLREEGVRSCQATPLVSGSGHLVGVISTYGARVHSPAEREFRFLDILARQAADIIERGRAEDEKVRLEDGLRRAQKMESVGTLASGIAHDFNNILAAILGNAEMAQEETSKSHPARTFIEQILKATFRGRDLVKRVLTFTRRPEKESKPTALTPLLEETFELLRASLPATVEMKVHAAAQPDIIRSDPSEIQQVILNLGTNAAHAMREQGGQLEITLRNVTFRAEQTVPDPDMAPGDYLALSVKDTGRGMTPEVLKRIFEPFFTTKPYGEGTGLGLYVVYGIVKRLSGGIRVSSSPKKGTTFTIYLPSFQASEEASREEVGWSSIPGGTERVLFIDDEAAVAELGAAVLNRLGYNVTTFSSAADALELFLKNPQAFDIVVTDQTMPGLTGIQLAARLLRVRPDLPVVLCSGYSETVSRAAAQEIGIREFLMKPIAKRELAEALRRALRKSV